MIPVPEQVLEALAHTYETRPSSLRQFGGRCEDSDGVRWYRSIAFE
jgi:hypothetical protein